MINTILIFGKGYFVNRKVSDDSLIVFLNLFEVFYLDGKFYRDAFGLHAFHR